jgi:hypothetical protein
MPSEPTTPKLLKHSVRNGVCRKRWLSTWYNDQGKRQSKHFGFEDETTRKQVMRQFETWRMTWRLRPDTP